MLDAGSRSSTSVRVTRAATGDPAPRSASAASSASTRMKPIVACVWATHQSNDTGGTTAADNSFFTNRFPTCGPLPWVTATW